MSTNSIAHLIELGQQDKLNVIWLYFANALEPATIDFVNGTRESVRVNDWQWNSFLQWLDENDYDIAPNFDGLKAKRGNTWGGKIPPVAVDTGMNYDKPQPEHFARFERSEFYCYMGSNGQVWYEDKL